MSDQPVLNTDRELWREIVGDYYSPSIHVTHYGGIGINLGGMVYVKPLSEWHKLAKRADHDAEVRKALADEMEKAIYRFENDARWMVDTDVIFKVLAYLRGEDR